MTLVCGVTNIVFIACFVVMIKLTDMQHSSLARDKEYTLKTL